MEHAYENTSEYDQLISKAGQFRAKKRIDDAIVECTMAIDWAVKNNSLTEEMKARNVLADIHRCNGDFDEVLPQYSKVLELGRKHNLQFSDEYIHALYHTVVFMTRIQPPPPQMFTLIDELVEVRSQMVDGDENDKDLQDYKKMQEVLKRTYKRKHRLRKQKEYTYNTIVGLVKQ
ncbi:MAG: hypothetical protein J6T88_10230 [Bacteroidales bacterium]|nr:hypothetical protein [Bacteroidales bacterium]